MYRLNKCLNMFSVCALLGAAPLVSANSSTEAVLSQDQVGLNQVALSLEKAIPAIVSSKDFRSASNTAFLLATARSRLDQPAAACAALSQSLEYYRQALAKETGEPQRDHGMQDESDGMAIVRAKFGCTHGHSA